MAGYHIASLCDAAATKGGLNSNHNLLFLVCENLLYFLVSLCQTILAELDKFFGSLKLYCYLIEIELSGLHLAYNLLKFSH